jgi:hypothetical protein
MYSDTKTAPAKSTPAETSPGPARAYRIVIGLAALVILLQALWAGLFIHEGQGYKDNWVEVHARGADIAILLTVVAFVIAVRKFRERRDLVIGTGVMAVLLMLEAYLGGLIGGSANVTIIHLPLGMALMALAVWLPMRSRSLRVR